MVKVIDVLDMSFVIGVDVPHLLELIKEGEYIIAMARLMSQDSNGQPQSGAAQNILEGGEPCLEKLRV